MFTSTRRRLLTGLAALPLAKLGSALLPDRAYGAQTIKLGFFAPLTGRFSGLGVDARRGAEFAAREVNERGGINGKKVELVVYDDRGDRKEAVSVVRKMMELDKVVAIDDGSLSLTSIAAAPFVNERKIPMVVAYSNAVGVVKDHPYAFRWASVADVQGWVMAHDAVKKRGYKTFAMFMQDEEYGRGIMNGAMRGIEKLGGKVLYKRAFSPGEKEFRSFLTEVKARRVDAVLVSGFGPSLVALGRQGWELDVFPKAQFYGGCDMNEIDWFEGIGELGDGALAVLEFIQGTDDPFTVEFVERWRRAYDTPIVTHEAGLTYDATRLLLDAVRRGGDTPEGIRRALADTKEFKNLSGVTVSFTKLREPLLPLALGAWDSKRKDFTLVEYIRDPALIDPSPWYQFYG